MHAPLMMQKKRKENSTAMHAHTLWTGQTVWKDSPRRKAKCFGRAPFSSNYEGEMGHTPQLCRKTRHNDEKQKTLERTSVVWANRQKETKPRCKTA